MLNRFFNNSQNIFLGIILLLGLISLYAELYVDGLPEFKSMFVLLVAIMSLVLWILILMTSLNIWQLRNVLQQFHADAKDIPYHDLTEQKPTPPNQFQPYIAEFEALGFMPFAVLNASAKNDSSQIIWYWTNEDHTIRAYLTITGMFKQVITCFASVMEDDAEIETCYRVRMQMDSDIIHIANVTTSIAAAYDYHLHQLTKYANPHGQPITIQSPSELIVHSNLLRLKHHPQAYQNRIQNLVHSLKFYGVTAIGFSTIWLLRDTVSIMLMVAVVSGLIALYIFIFKIEATTSAYGSVEHRKKKKNS